MPRAGVSLDDVDADAGLYVDDGDDVDVEIVDAWSGFPARSRRNDDDVRDAGVARVPERHLQAVAAPPEPAPWTEPTIHGGIPGRRTVTIHGRGAERYTPSRRRSQRPIHYRSGFRPDRAAMWAVLLGFLLVVVAATSSHAATLRARPLATPKPQTSALTLTLTLASRE